MEYIISLGFFFVFIMLGLVLGQWNRSKHLRSLAEREAAHADFLITNIPSFPFQADTAHLPMLVTGEAVVASDYLKTFLSSWRKFFGGNMASFEDLEMRARREAILRLIESATQQGYNAACNLRLNAVDIANAVNDKNALPIASFTADATAYVAT